MATYYGFLWSITILNLFRCVLQMTQTGSNHSTLWNVFWLLTRFGELKPYTPTAVLVRQLEPSFFSNLAGQEQYLLLCSAWDPCHGWDVGVNWQCCCRHDLPGGLCGGLPVARLRVFRQAGEWKHCPSNAQHTSSAWAEQDTLLVP